MAVVLRVGAIEEHSLLSVKNTFQNFLPDRLKSQGAAEILLVLLPGYLKGLFCNI